MPLQDVCLSVRPSVRLSVTRRYSAKTAKHIGPLKLVSPSGIVIHCESKKLDPFSFEHNYGKYCPISIFFFTVADRNQLRPSVP